MCVCILVLVIRHAQHMRHIILSICGLSDCTIHVFSQIITQKARFSENILCSIKCVFGIFLQFLFKMCLKYKKNPTRYYHKCTPLLMQITRHSCESSTKLEYSGQISKKKKNPYIKFRENPSSVCVCVCVCVPSSSIWTGGQADMTKPAVTFRIFKLLTL